MVDPQVSLFGKKVKDQIAIFPGVAYLMIGFKLYFYKSELFCKFIFLQGCLVLKHATKSTDDCEINFSLYIWLPVWW